MQVLNALTGYGSDGATHTGIEIKASVITIKGQISAFSKGITLLNVNISVNDGMMIKEFVNDTEYSGGIDNTSNSLCIETKDFDFEYPGVKKNVYKLIATMKGRGNFIVEFSVNASDEWYPLSDESGTPGQFTIDTSSWIVKALDFSGYTNASISGDGDTNLYQYEAVQDNVVRDIKSIRFRLRSQGHVSGFELNDMTVYYRLKGII